MSMQTKREEGSRKSIAEDQCEQEVLVETINSGKPFEEPSKARQSFNRTRCNTWPVDANLPPRKSRSFSTQFLNDSSSDFEYSASTDSKNADLLDSDDDENFSVIDGQINTGSWDPRNWILFLAKPNFPIDHHHRSQSNTIRDLATAKSNTTNIRLVESLAFFCCLYLSPILAVAPMLMYTLQGYTRLNLQNIQWAVFLPLAISTIKNEFSSASKKFLNPKSYSFITNLAFTTVNLIYISRSSNRTKTLTSLNIFYLVVLFIIAYNIFLEKISSQLVLKPLKMISYIPIFLQIAIYRCDNHIKTLLQKYLPVLDTKSLYLLSSEMEDFELRLDEKQNHILGILTLLHFVIIRILDNLLCPSLSDAEMLLASTGVSCLLANYLFQTSNIIDTFLLSCILFLLICTFPLLPFFLQSMSIARILPQFRSENVIKTHKLISHCCLCYTVISTFVLLVPACKKLFHVNWADFYWEILLTSENSQTRWKITLFWLISLGICALIVGGVLMQDKGRNRNDKLNLKRKIFHFTITIMIVPAINIDYEYCAFGLAAVLLIFLLLEIWRICALPPYALWLHCFLHQFTNSRDHRGILISSHISLLIGIATPLWLEISTEWKLLQALQSGSQSPSIAAYAGILSLGLGDSVASIIGKKFGKHYWKGMQKTMEGTAAYILSIIIAIFAMQYYNVFQVSNWASTIIATFWIGLIEAFCLQDDNVVIPPFYWCLLQQ